MAKRIKCNKCGRPVSEWDLLEGYCILCAGRIIQVACECVELKNASGEDLQRKRKEAWKNLMGAVG